MIYLVSDSCTTTPEKEKKRSSPSSQNCPIERGFKDKFGTRKLSCMEGVEYE